MNSSFCVNFAGFTGKFEKSGQNYSRLSVLNPFYSITCILDLLKMQLLMAATGIVWGCTKGSNFLGKRRMYENMASQL